MPETIHLNMRTLSRAMIDAMGDTNYEFKDAGYRLSFLFKIDGVEFEARIERQKKRKTV